MVWTAPTPGPVAGPLVGDDRPMLAGYLAWERFTLLNICAGLDGPQLASRPLGSSRLSLLGIVRHLAKVERIWFRQRAAGEAVEPIYDLSYGKDFDFEATEPTRAEGDFRRLQDEWRWADASVAALPFTHTFDVDNQTFSLRMMYVHMIGEYARHNGHADMLREAIDGATGR